MDISLAPEEQGGDEISVTRHGFDSARCFTIRALVVSWVLFPSLSATVGLFISILSFCSAGPVWKKKVLKWLVFSKNSNIITDFNLMLHHVYILTHLRLGIFKVVNNLHPLINTVLSWSTSKINCLVYALSHIICH